MKKYLVLFLNMTRLKINFFTFLFIGLIVNVSLEQNLYSLKPWNLLKRILGVKQILKSADKNYSTVCRLSSTPKAKVSNSAPNSVRHKGPYRSSSKKSLLEKQDSNDLSKILADLQKEIPKSLHSSLKKKLERVDSNDLSRILAELRNKDSLDESSKTAISNKSTSSPSRYNSLKKPLKKQDSSDLRKILTELKKLSAPSSSESEDSNNIKRGNQIRTENMTKQVQISPTVDKSKHLISAKEKFLNIDPNFDKCNLPGTEPKPLKSVNSFPNVDEMLKDRKECPTKNQNENEKNGHYVFVKEFSKVVCAGALIDERFVVTAAQCKKLCNSRSESLIAYRIIVGAQSMFKGGRAMEIERVRCHPCYEKDDSGYRIYDLAVVQLKQSIKFVPFTSVIALPNTGTTKNALSHNSCVYQTLRQDGVFNRPVSIHESNWCGIKFSRYIPKSYICGENPCRTQSSSSILPGTPLVCDDVLIGMLTWSGVVTKNNKAENLDMYTRIESYAYFLNVTLNEDNFRLKPKQPLLRLESSRNRFLF